MDNVLYSLGCGEMNATQWDNLILSCCEPELKHLPSLQPPLLLLKAPFPSNKHNLRHWTETHPFAIWNDPPAIWTDPFGIWIDLFTIWTDPYNKDPSAHKSIQKDLPPQSVSQFFKMIGFACSAYHALKAKYKSGQFRNASDGMTTSQMRMNWSIVAVASWSC